jgi:hypothetical protein
LNFSCAGGRWNHLVSGANSAGSWADQSASYSWGWTIVTLQWDVVLSCEGQVLFDYLCFVIFCHEGFIRMQLHCNLRITCILSYSYLFYHCRLHRRILRCPLLTPPQALATMPDNPSSLPALWLLNSHEEEQARGWPGSLHQPDPMSMLNTGHTIQTKHTCDPVSFYLNLSITPLLSFGIFSNTLCGLSSVCVSVYGQIWMEIVYLNVIQIIPFRHTELFTCHQNRPSQIMGDKPCGTYRHF